MISKKLFKKESMDFLIESLKMALFFRDVNEEREDKDLI